MSTQPFPISIRVGPHRFSLSFDEDMSSRGANGETYPERLRIAVAPDLADTREREVVLHEVIHSIWHNTDLRSEDSGIMDKEEQVISALAPVLLDVLRDNPKLIDYLRE